VLNNKRNADEVRASIHQWELKNEGRRRQVNPPLTCRNLRDVSAGNLKTRYKNSEIPISTNKIPRNMSKARSWGFTNKLLFLEGKITYYIASQENKPALI